MGVAVRFTRRPGRLRPRGHASLPVGPFPSQSLDPVADQRRLVRDLAEAAPAAARKQQQQQQHEEDQGADGDQGVGHHPQHGRLEAAARAVGRHVRRGERPRDLRERQPAAGCRQQSWSGPPTPSTLHPTPTPTPAGPTCTGAEGEAQPPLGAVKHHVEALHHGGADHQPVHGRGHAEAEAVQRSVQVGDLLDVELRGGGTA